MQFGLASHWWARMAQARWATLQHACGIVALLSALAQQAHGTALARPLTTAAARQTAHRLIPGADAALYRCSVTDSFLMAQYMGSPQASTRRSSASKAATM